MMTNSTLSRRFAQLKAFSFQKNPRRRRTRRRPQLRHALRVSTFEHLEPLILFDGDATVELVSPPSYVADNERTDITVRYKMTGSDGGPFLIEELSIRDSDPVGAFNRIARTDGQRFSQQGVWYYHTFENVDLSDYDDGGNGIELYAHVDIDNQAAFRADATDNSPTQQVTVGQPDLIVKSLDVEDTEVEPGDKIDIDAVVENIGTANAARGRVHFYLGPDRGSRAAEIGWGFMPNVGVLSPGEEEGEHVGNFAIPDWPDGTYYVTAVADSQSDVNESSESNNEKYVEITIGTPREENLPEPVATMGCGEPTGAGVTVITHGFQLGGGANSTTPDWTLEMAEAILERHGDQGSILVHDPNLNRWVAPDQRGFEIDWQNSNDLNDEIVLVYDWTWESNDLGYGWQEAAADSLFTNLVAPFGFSGEQHNLLMRPLHFIGHSRGTIVNSLAAHRLDYHFPATPIFQFTSLDPHPSVLHKDPGYDHDPRVLQIPDNVQWADNYYRADGAYELDNDFNGVPVAGAFNLRLEESVLFGEGHLQEHSDAHLWYLATIKHNASEVEGYKMDGGFDEWWTSGLAFDSDVESASGRGNIGFARSRIGGAALLTDQMDRDLLTTAQQPELVFNGHFDYGEEFLNQIPGWERHGGGGSGNLDGGSNNYLQLNDNDHDRLHNAMYIPPTVSHIEFDYWIHNNDALNTNDQLEVRIDNDLIGTIGLGDETNGYVRDFRIPLTAAQVGSVHTMEFRIGGSGDIQSAIRIDNVDFVEQRATRSIGLSELQNAIANHDRDSIFDLNHDNQVDSADGSYFLNYCQVVRGDANLDGRFESSDIIRTFAAGKYETGMSAAWSEGDWNFDGRFDTGDLIAAFQENKYEQPDRAEAVVQPPRQLGNSMPTRSIFVDRSSADSLFRIESIDEDDSRIWTELKIRS